MFGFHAGIILLVALCTGTNILIEGDGKRAGDVVICDMDMQ